MKKINSIDYGGKVIGIGVIFGLVIPVVLFFVREYIYDTKIIQILQYLMVGIGLLIEAIFFIHLGMELRQDRIIENFYSENPDSRKTPQQILDDYKKK